LKVCAFLAGALLVTTAITAGVAALYESRPIDTSALLSAEHTPLVVTATRLKKSASALATSGQKSPLAKPECQSIAC
jgi:hypothetical protein